MNNTVFPRIMLPYYPIFLSADFLLDRTTFYNRVSQKKKKTRITKNRVIFTNLISSFLKSKN